MSATVTPWWWLGREVIAQDYKEDRREYQHPAMMRSQGWEWRAAVAVPIDGDGRTE